MKLSDLKHAGHFPTLIAAFLDFDYSFMVWTLLGALGAQIAAPESLNLSAQQKGLMVLPYGEIEPFQNPQFRAVKAASAHNPNIPPWLDAVLLRATAVRPRDVTRITRR